jgi:hypothetical protein
LSGILVQARQALSHEELSGRLTNMVISITHGQMNIVAGGKF